MPKSQYIYIYISTNCVYIIEKNITIKKKKSLRTPLCPQLIEVLGSYDS